MALPHFGAWGNFVPNILKEDANHYIKSRLKEIKSAFENADISLNGQGKDLIFLSGNPNSYKEERIENGITYLVYKSEHSGIIAEYYTINNKLHRENGPAYIETSEDKIHESAYFKNDMLHNEDGPATTGTRINGTIESAFWYKGKFITKEKFNIVQRKKKLQKINKSRNV